MFSTTGSVYFYRTLKEAHNPDCRFQAVKYVGGSVMIWAAIYWYSTRPIINLNGRITAIDYVDILGHQVHPMVQMFLPNNDVIFKDDHSPIHTARSVQPRSKEHEDALPEHPWP